MSEICADLLLIGISFASFGLPAMLYLAPPCFCEELFGWCVGLPVAGLASALVGATFFFGSGIPFSALLPTLLGLSLLSLVGDLRRGPRSRLRALGRFLTEFKVSWRDFPFALLFVASFVLALVPCLVKGYSTTPFRFGPDGPLYAQAAHYLANVDPHAALPDIRELEHTVSHKVGLTYPHLVLAAYVVHLRWGFPLLTAISAQVTHATHPFAVMFLLSAFMLGTCALLGRFIARRFFSLSSAASWLCATALMAHAALLNTLLENQHPNVAFLCFSCGLLALVLNARATEPSVGSFAFAGLCWGAILSVYSESLPMLGAYFFWVILLDLMSRNGREALATFKFLLISLVLGLLFVAPYTALVAKHLFTLSTENVGYPQPRWAWPSEILGLGNAFAGGVARWTSEAGEPITVSRSARDLRWVVIATLLTAAAAFCGGRRMRTSLRNVWLGAIFPILMVLTLTIVRHKHNYLYTKASVMLTPVLVVGFISALWGALPTTRSNSARLAIVTTWCLAIFGFGVTYLHDYLREYRVLSPQFLRLGSLNLSGEHIILLPDPWGRRGGGHLRYVDRTSEMYELTFPSVQALETNTFCVNPKAFEEAYDYRVFRFRRVEAGDKAETSSPRTVLEGDNFTIFETNYRVKDLVKMAHTCAPGLYDSTDQKTPSKPSSF